MTSAQFMGPVVLWFCLLFYGGIPAVIAALSFRGGLVLLATGVTFVGHDGRQASRVRLFWRSLLAWSPLAGAIALSVAAMPMQSVALVWLSGLLLAILAGWSLWLPDRGLQDRLAGTWPVPR